MQQQEDEYENITRAQLTDGEFKEYTDMLAESQANMEVLNACIDKMRRETMKSTVKKNKWWKRMSDKYGFRITSGTNIDSRSKSIMEMVPKQEPHIREALELTKTDPDKIDASSDYHEDGCCKSDCDPQPEPQPEGEAPQ
jgi:hypothetical protein